MRFEGKSSSFLKENFGVANRDYIHTAVCVSKQQNKYLLNLTTKTNVQNIFKISIHIIET